MKFFAGFREIAGEKETCLDLPDKATAGRALEILCQKYGEKMRARIFKGAELKPYVLVLVNGRHIGLLQGLETELKDQDTVAILPPVGGG